MNNRHVCIDDMWSLSGDEMDMILNALEILNPYSPEVNESRARLWRRLYQMSMNDEFFLHYVRINHDTSEHS